MRLIDGDKLIARYPECRDLKRKVDEMPTVAEWIRCDERKPDDNREVWVFLSNGKIRTDCYVADDDGERDYEVGRGRVVCFTMNGWQENSGHIGQPVPTHWMPIPRPEPPKEEKT